MRINFPHVAGFARAALPALLAMLTVSACTGESEPAAGSMERFAEQHARNEDLARAEALAQANMRAAARADTDVDAFEEQERRRSVDSK
jgi:hypothetical protein